MHAITYRNVLGCLQNFYQRLKIKHLLLQNLTLRELDIYTYAYGCLMEPSKEVEPNLYLKHILNSRILR